MNIAKVNVTRGPTSHCIELGWFRCCFTALALEDIPTVMELIRKVAETRKSFGWKTKFCTQFCFMDCWWHNYVSQSTLSMAEQASQQKIQIWCLGSSSNFHDLVSFRMLWIVYIFVWKWEAKTIWKGLIKEQNSVWFWVIDALY